MTAEDNAATYRRWFDEGCSQGNVDLADELYSAEYVTHSRRPGPSPHAGGAEDVHPRLAGGDARPAVPRWKRWSRRATAWPAGSPCGARTPAPCSASRRPGRQVDVGVMVIARFDEAGKWVEDWASWDQLGMLQQLGVIPAPAAA